MPDFAQSETKPVLVACYYKHKESSLIVLATAAQSGFVIVPSDEYDVGEHADDWVRFNDETVWEYFIGEIVTCNPTIPVGQSEEEANDT